MKGEVRRRAGARQDLVEIVRRYAREAGHAVARRFAAEAEATLARLAELPELGTRFEADHPALAGIRYLPIGGPFGAYVVFYRPCPGGIEVARVLHGARDIDGILSGEGEP